ncbi:MAG: DUF1259 domain-containing protein [Gemmatimonadota bacterium]|nr:DUF1259 domain-containing protein [Gemmatimonadota bacterium]
MKSSVAFVTHGFLIACVASTVADRAAAQNRRTRQPPAPDWSVVENALGRKGTPSPGGVARFGFPRSDLNVVLHGVTLKPALALGSWVAFKRIADHAMVMGDLVLLETEVTTVMASLQQNGVDQTALHNHLLGESPRVMYMHIHAIGNAERIAKAVRTALEFTNTPLGAASPTSPAPTVSAAPITLDTTMVAKTLGVTGRTNGGIYQLSIPRRERICDDGQEIPPAMGVATAINFQPVVGGKAAITGDFVLLGREVNPVLWTLGENAIEVTAIHSHMTDEQPRLYFMHFWAVDDAAKLARGLRAAIDRTNRRVPTSKLRPCKR